MSAGAQGERARRRKRRPHALQTHLTGSRRAVAHVEYRRRFAERSVAHFDVFYTPTMYKRNAFECRKSSIVTMELFRA
eukprot:5713936-Pleurochrysis_carterae.AAC.1